MIPCVLSAADAAYRRGFRRSSPGLARPGHGAEVDDLIALGPSHPCTTFDKWRVVHLVDDDYNLLEAIPTYF
jgi:D-serine deaminase-like pyridoxal phosphate-dependent protein